MNKTTLAIIDANRGRDPERLKMKLAALRDNPFAFFRGTAGLFYSTLRLDKSLLASPTVLACGDLHLENFATYKGDNRLVYFDMSDFDEGCVAPFAFDVVRFAASIQAAAKSLKLRDESVTKLVTLFLETYAINVASAKPRWIERSVAGGPVKSLLQSLKRRTRDDQILERTVRKGGKTRLKIDGKKTLALNAGERKHAEAILSAFAKLHATPAFFAPVDIARRIAGTGSLGLERYVALVRGSDKAGGQYLIDMKFAGPSALAPQVGNSQPQWKSNAARAAAIQRVSQAIPPALLGAVDMGKRSYLVRELQPTADRIDLAKLAGKSAARGGLAEVITNMAEITAWAHLRTCGRFGAGSVDELVEFVSRTPWRGRVTANAGVAAERSLRQWKEYSVDYDSDAKGLLASCAA